MKRDSINNNKLNSILTSGQKAQAERSAMESASYPDSFISSLPEEYSKEKAMLFEAAEIRLNRNNPQEPFSVLFDLGSTVHVGEDADLTALTECYKELCNATVSSTMKVKELQPKSNNDGEFPHHRTTYSPNARPIDVPLTQATIDKITAAKADLSIAPANISQKLTMRKTQNTAFINGIFDGACERLQSLVTNGDLTADELHKKLSEKFGLSGPAQDAGN